MQTVTSEVDGIVHIATPRNEARLMIEIETDLVGTFSLAEQAIEAPYPKPGVPKQPHKQTIVIYERDLPKVQALVRTDVHNSALARAMEMAPSDKEIVEARRTAEANLARAMSPEGTASSRERAEQELNRIKFDAMRKALELLHTMPGCKDGLPPLLSARVVKAGIGAPPTTQTLLENGNANLASVLERLLDARDARAKSKG